MNTNYDEEATRFPGIDDEATQFNHTSAAQQTGQNADSNDGEDGKAAGNSRWKSVAAGAGSGLLIGSVATVLMSMKSDDTDVAVGKNDGKEEINHSDEPSHPEWVDDHIHVATSVNDDMSFGEAFAAARAEVGPGGCFEWHGNIYGTYTAAEWDHMTAEQRAEWSDHFNWNHIDHSSGNVAQHSTSSHTDHAAHSAHTDHAGHSAHTDHADHSAHTDHSAPAHTGHTADNDDIEVVSVNHNDNTNDLAQHQTVTTTPGDIQGENIQGEDMVLVSEAEPEIEILGVVHDDETGANIGGMTVDGQEVILIDVDGNMLFDYLATDINGNGQIDKEELVDIQSEGITVNDIGGFTTPVDDMMANNGTPDYNTSDPYGYEG